MKKPLILIVDDDIEITKAFSEAILDSGNYEVLAANSGKAALEMISSNKTLMGVGANNVKLILLDIRMPEMSGIELLDRLEKDFGGRMDVIMVTAFDDDDNWSDSFFAHSNVIAFLKKPIDRKGLVEVIDKYFRGDKEKLRQASKWEYGSRSIMQQQEKTKKEIKSQKGSLPKEK
jgi:two-component system CheB/CheR fusion protein